MPRQESRPTAPKEEPGPEQKPQPDATQNGGKKRPLLIVLTLIVLVGLAMGIRYWRFASTHASTDNAAIASDVIQISPQVSGTVKQVLVKDNQLVKAGDLIVVLDDSTYRASVAQAQANLDAAVAQAKGAGVSVSITSQTGAGQEAQAQGAVEQAQSGISSAQADVAKGEAAVSSAIAMSKSAQAGIGTARAAVNVAISNKQRFAEAVNSAQAQVQTAEAGVRAAQASVDAAQANATKSANDARRYQLLFSKGAVSEQVVDQANAASTSTRAQLEAAREQVASAQATVLQRKADLGGARQQIEGADAAIAQARAQLSASQDQSSAAQAGIRSAQAQLSAAQQSVQAAMARRQQTLGQLTQAKTAPSQVAVSRTAQQQAQAKIEQAQAALRAAKIQLGYTKIYAPKAGRVSKKTVEVGALVQPGAPLMAILPNNDVWVVANYKETQLSNMRVGQPAEIEVDAFPGRSFSGRVDSIAPATGSTFALLPPDNATGNFVKVVQRVPVKIVLDPGQPDIDRLSAGMSVTAVIKVK